MVGKVNTFTQQQEGVLNILLSMNGKRDVLFVDKYVLTDADGKNTENVTELKVSTWFQRFVEVLSRMFRSQSDQAQKDELNETNLYNVRVQIHQAISLGHQITERGQSQCHVSLVKRLKKVTNVAQLKEQVEYDLSELKTIAANLDHLVQRLQRTQKAGTLVWASRELNEELARLADPVVNTGTDHPSKGSRAKHKRKAKETRKRVNAELDSSSERLTIAQRVVQMSPEERESRLQAANERVAQKNAERVAAAQKNEAAELQRAHLHDLDTRFTAMEEQLANVFKHETPQARLHAAISLAVTSVPTDIELFGQKCVGVFPHAGKAAQARIRVQLTALVENLKKLAEINYQGRSAATIASPLMLKLPLQLC